jgi:transposase-like protein
MSRLSAPEFYNEQAAFMHFESVIWPNGARCPHCGGTERLSRLKGRSVKVGLWQCCRCRKQFTARIGTFFEGSRLPMTKWLQAIYLMASSKKDIPAYQLQRILEVQYNTAWFIVHRVRVARQQLHTKKIG